MGEVAARLRLERHRRSKALDVHEGRIQPWRVRAHHNVYKDREELVRAERAFAALCSEALVKALFKLQHAFEHAIHLCSCGAHANELTQLGRRCIPPIEAIVAELGRDVELLLRLRQYAFQ